MKTTPSKRAAVWLLVLVSIASSGVASESEMHSPDPDWVAGIKPQLDELQRQRAKIDRSRLDSDEMLDRLDYDASEIIRFVQQDVAYQRYPAHCEVPPEPSAAILATCSTSHYCWPSC